MIERCVMLFLNVSCIISLVGWDWPTAKNISCSFLSIVVTIHIYSWDIQQYKIGDPILFLDSDRFFPVIHNNMKGIITGIEILDPDTHVERIQFNVEIPKAVDESDLQRINLELLECYESEEKSLIRFCVYKLKNADEDGDGNTSNTVVPFQIAYAVSIHKA